ncbi:hypothetical protein AVEN_162558-1 [Araneus ventricosus]|uniref:Integrase p58-like C-terminal domain-containing protein n=1 Tax=Araneus ventricosus TaxID=182803 RepID=A0A4Y2KTX0_ARAVE|nr:hypothetical protein AVEN_162558-1 [Araneus ventricosus]
MKTRCDSGATGHHFKEGDQVWMYNPKRRRGLSPKLQQNWEGPYTIVKKLNDVIYRVQRSPNAEPKVIHINRLTPYRATDHSSVFKRHIRRPLLLGPTRNNWKDPPSLQEIAWKSPATKQILLGLFWDSCVPGDGVLYRKWESDDGKFLPLAPPPESRIQEVL